MYYFIVNPKAKSKKGKELWSVVSDRLKKDKIPHQVFFTKYRGHAAALSREITRKDPACTVVAVGGDGTIHEVLTGLTHHQSVTFGCIPSGSGNDFARGMKIPSDPLVALEHILHPVRTMDMDLGTVLRDNKKQRFGVSAGIGYDASICHEALSSSLKTFLNRIHLGKLTYIFLAMKQILMYQTCPITLELNGNRHYTFQKAYFAAVFNQNAEGGGLKLCPKAKPNDQVLDVIVVDHMPRMMIFFLLPLAFTGLHTHIKGVHIFRCKDVWIHAASKRPIHLDGESGGIHEDLHIAMESKPLKVLI